MWLGATILGGALDLQGGYAPQCYLLASMRYNQDIQ